MNKKTLTLEDLPPSTTDHETKTSSWWRRRDCIDLGEQSWRSGESARLPPVCPGIDSRTRCHMWVEFVVASLPCSERFFSGYSGFPLSSKTIISKFQFDLDYCQALYHEPLAQVFAQALRVFDIKFAFACTFTLIKFISYHSQPHKRLN